MRLLVAWGVLVIACVLCVLPAAADQVHDLSAPPAGSLNSPMTGCNTGNIILPRMDRSHPVWSSRFFRDTIPPGTARSWIDLKWSQGPGQYALYVYTPEMVLGPYGNMANGVEDERIFLEIAADRNLTSGSWYYQVRGSGDSPCNGYSFRTYRNTGAGGA